MIILDTNIVSAVMLPEPPTEVVLWLERQETLSLFLSSVRVAEIRYGLAILPDGQKRQRLRQRFSDFVALGFEQRVLPFDSEAASHYGEIMAHRRSLGRPMSYPDGQIASIARQHRFAVATRNVGDFEECGVEIMNPFGDQLPDGQPA